MQSAKKNEKGIALIFTLIMLSLLMILALSFALDSMFEQKAAYNSANTSSSGFMAQAQLKQVLLLIEKNQANYDESRVFSHDSEYNYSVTPIPDIYTDMLIDRLPVDGVLDSTDSCLSPTVNINWNYIKANGSIIGRTAFVVVPDDKIPLDSLVDDRVGTATYPKHNETDDSEARIGKYVSEINVRAAIPAVATNLSIITDKLNWLADNPVAGAGFPNGKYIGNNWTSYTNLFTAVEAAPNPITLSSDDKKEIEDRLSLAVADDNEEFWADLDDDPNTNANELFKRFDLTESNLWGSGILSEDHFPFLQTVILLIDSSTGTVPNIAMTPWDSNPADDTSWGLPWLACFGYKVDGSGLDTNLGKTFGNDATAVYNRRCQIAANLKDYSDTDNHPTSNVVPTETAWKATEPDYTGNEKTPYINKIGVRVEIQRINSSTIFGDKVYIEPIVKPVIGLINIYDQNYTNLKVFIDGSVTVEISVDGGGSVFNTTTVPFSRDVDFLSTPPSNDCWQDNNGHSRLILGNEDSLTVLVASGAGCFATMTVVKVVDVKINKIFLHNYSSTDAYDYAKVSALTPNFIAFPDSSSAGEQTSWYGWAVHDPRQNLNVDDWQALAPTTAATAAVGVDDNPSKTFSVVVGNPPYSCAPNADNSNNGGGTDTVSPNVGGADADAEPVDQGTASKKADPANRNLSTAFIRNAPMESPWELGFIHRGYRWQTINLKKYDSTKAIKVIDIGGNKYIPGGGAYADGDANILDQIKMTATAKSPQKISITSQTIEVLEALLSKVKYGCIIDRSSTPANHMTVKSIAGIDPVTGADLSGNELAGNITVIGNNIINKYKNSVGNDMRTRASVIDKLLLSDTSIPAVPLTDAAQEELIGKIVNLTKIGSQGAGGGSGSFRVIVLAQTIKDVGGTGGTIDIHKYADDETTNATMACKIGIFDADIDLTNPEQSIYYDEITGEQKIMISGNVSTTGDIKITSFQYID